MDVRDYGDNQTIVLHLAPDHPRLSELKSRAAWIHAYNDTRQRGRLVGFDLAFRYNGDRPALVRELQQIAKI